MSTKGVVKRKIINGGQVSLGWATSGHIANIIKGTLEMDFPHVFGILNKI